VIRGLGPLCLWHQLLFGMVIWAGSGLANAATFECLIEPTRVVEIRSPVEGLIDKIFVERGDLVTAGQVLVELQSDVERSTVESARFRAEMEGHIKAAKDRLAFAEKKLERWQDLLKQNFVATQDRDEAETEKRLAESELQQAIEERDLARLEHRRAVDLLNLRTLRSPFDGVVVDRLLNPGDLAESGTGRKPMLKLAQIDPLRVEVSVPQETYGKIQVGMTATVIPEGLGGRYTARVMVVDRVLDAASGTLGVRLELPNKGGALPGGLRCQVEFTEF
jgi:RND family efflux transporter MFP subunit